MNLGKTEVASYFLWDLVYIIAIITIYACLSMFPYLTVYKASDLGVIVQDDHAY